MNDDQREKPEAAGADASTKRSGVGKLLVQVLALFVATVITVVLIAWFVPEGNTYSKVSTIKHARLEQLPSPKIVVVGGSNLAFGLDSPLIEKVTGRGVVNMGMDGFLGMRFMLAEVEPFLRESDLVVLAFEHGAYINDVNGVAENQFAVIKANPKAIAFINWEQQKAMLPAIPRIAQLKAARFVLEPARAVRSLIKGKDYQSAGQVEEAIGSVDGFNEHGDLLAHLDIVLPGEPFDGDNLKAKPLNQEALDLLNDFATRVGERGVEVLVSYTPVADTYFERYEEELGALHEAITAQPALHAPMPPSDFVYPVDEFFDTVYHLRRAAREQRTRKLIQAIQTKIAHNQG